MKAATLIVFLLLGLAFTYGKLLKLTPCLINLVIGILLVHELVAVNLPLLAYERHLHAQSLLCYIVAILTILFAHHISFTDCMISKFVAVFEKNL